MADRLRMIVLQGGKALANPLDIMPGSLMLATLRQPGLPMLAVLFPGLLVVELDIPLRSLFETGMADGVRCGLCH
ncbi:hypothetical protein D3C79_1055480 [compost metagenome]